MKNLGFLGYPDYAVSKEGKVYSNYSNRFLKSSVSSTSKACRVNVRNGEGIKTIEIHRLVAQSFLPNPEGYLVVNHKDGNRSNNNVSNLEWCTHEYNSIHATELVSSSVRGLSVPEVHVILRMLEEGYRNKDVADITGHSYAVVSKIKQGANYRDIWEEYTIPRKSQTVSLEKVRYIKKLLLTDNCFIGDIAKELKCSRNLVKDIRDGIRFKNI